MNYSAYFIIWYKFLDVVRYQCYVERFPELVIEKMMCHKNDPVLQEVGLETLAVLASAGKTKLKILYLFGILPLLVSPLPGKPKGTLGLHSVRLSVRSISFPEFFPKCLQVLTWFLACKSISAGKTKLKILYLFGILPLLVNPLPGKPKGTLGLHSVSLSVCQSGRPSVCQSTVLVFRNFFLNACRYWPDFWHVSQSPWLTDRVWVSLCSIDFWRNYRLWTL